MTIEDNHISSNHPENLKKDLEKAKDLINALINETGVGYASHKMIYDKNGNPTDYIFLNVNGTFEELTGLKKEDILGKSVLEVLPETEEIWIKRYGEVAKTGKSIKFENYSKELNRYFQVNAFSTEKDYFTVTFTDTTASYKTKQELTKTKGFYEDLLETVKEGIWVSDKNDTIYYVNTGMASIIGAPNSKIIGKNVLNDFPEETVKEFKHFYIEAKQKLKPTEYVAKVKTLNFRDTYQSGWLIPVINEGKYDGMICSTLDITEQKKSRKIIKKREEQLSYIIDHSTNAFYSHTADHVLTYFSPQIEKILGYKPEEILTNWMKLTSDNPINKRGLKVTNKAIKTGETQKPYELELKHKNGSLIRVEVREAPVVENGKTVAIVGALTDITEKLRIERQLRINKKSLKNLIDNSPVSIAVINKDGTTEYLNKEFTSVFGYTLEEIRHEDDWWPKAYPDPGYRQEIKKQWHEELEKRSSKLFNVTITCKNMQKKFVQISWAGIGDKFMLILNNLTDQKTLQNQLVESNLQLKSTLSKIRKLNSELNDAKKKAEESDRLKSAFLANMSHEIRTPMNSIIGFSNLLADDELEDSKRKQFSKLIQASGEHLLRIIDDIIDIAKIESNQLKIEKRIIDVNQLLDEIYNYHLESKLKKINNKIEFILQNKASSPELYLYTDIIRIKQLFDNLITNALKYTKRGIVKIGIHKIDLDDQFITFYIKDTGIGIPNKYKTQIFNRFMQLENNLPRQGTGLGLSITKGIALLLGGNIWFESEENTGSTFYFKMPWDPEIKPIPVKEIEDLVKTKELSEKTIYIAEDDYPSYLFLYEILNPTGAIIKRFANGKLLVEGVKHATPDLILADINMPVMNGIDAVSEIRKMGFNGPIIAQTAYAMSEEKKRCLDAQCDDYISKPVDMKLILDLVYKSLS